MALDDTLELGESFDVTDVIACERCKLCFEVISFRTVVATCWHNEHEHYTTLSRTS